MQRLSLASIGHAVLALVAGLVLGAFGTVMHRSVPPWGAVLGLALVLAVAVAMRAWRGLVALLGFGIGVLVSVQVLAQTGPGGDVLVPSGDRVGWEWLGWLWVLGSIVAVIVAALLPRRWFVDGAPASSTAPTGETAPAWPPTFDEVAPAGDEPRPCPKQSTPTSTARPLRGSLRASLWWCCAGGGCSTR